MKQTMGKGTNIGWIGCRATRAVEEMFSSGNATADLLPRGNAKLRIQCFQASRVPTAGRDCGWDFQVRRSCGGTADRSARNMPPPQSTGPLRRAARAPEMQRFATRRGWCGDSVALPLYLRTGFGFQCEIPA